MQIVINIPDASIKDYQDLYYKIHSMAASEGLFDDKKKSQRALALKVVLDVLEGVVNGTPLPKGHGDLIDRNSILCDDSPCDLCGHADECFKLLASTIIEADKEK